MRKVKCTHYIDNLESQLHILSVKAQNSSNINQAYVRIPTSLLCSKGGSSYLHTLAMELCDKMTTEEGEPMQNVTYTWTPLNLMDVFIDVDSYEY